MIRPHICFSSSREDPSPTSFPTVTCLNKSLGIIEWTLETEHTHYSFEFIWKIKEPVSKITQDFVIHTGMVDLVFVFTLTGFGAKFHVISMLKVMFLVITNIKITKFSLHEPQMSDFCICRGFNICNTYSVWRKKKLCFRGSMWISSDACVLSSLICCTVVIYN